MPRLATQIIRRADGGEALRLPRVHLVVTAGPDQGLERTFEGGRVVLGSEPGCDLVLTDPAVSQRHAVLITGPQGTTCRDLGSTNGTLIAGLGISEVTLTGPATLELGGTRVAVSPGEGHLELPLSPRTRFGELLGQGPAMRRVFALLEKAAASEATVLLQGDSGTGKELAARALHQASPRGAGPFIVVDCGALPAALIESELFGHEQGAFTGAAKQRAGALEQAEGGTLFIDEVGELALDLQPRLLRFLERREVRRVGGAETREVDVRIIAATNRRLAAEAEAGRFRQDLYFRLAVVQVELPALCEHPEDILPLARRFAAEFREDPGELISAEVARLLTSYGWPGNVRELRNAVERLALVPELGAGPLGARPEGSPGPSIGALANLTFHEARQRWQDLFEQQYLGIQLARAEDKVSWAAKCAGLPRQTFNRLLRKHSLRRPSGE